MIKEVLAHVDLTAWQEVSLLLFAAVFVVVAIRTLLGDRAESRRHAAIAVADDSEVPR